MRDNTHQHQRGLDTADLGIIGQHLAERVDLIGLDVQHIKSRRAGRQIGGDGRRRLASIWPIAARTVSPSPSAGRPAPPRPAGRQRRQRRTQASRPRGRCAQPPGTAPQAIPASASSASATAIPPAVPRASQRLPDSNVAVPMRVSARPATTLAAVQPGRAPCAPARAAAAAAPHRTGARARRSRRQNTVGRPHQRPQHGRAALQRKGQQTRQDRRGQHRQQRPEQQTHRDPSAGSPAPAPASPPGSADHRPPRCPEDAQRLAPRHRPRRAPQWRYRRRRRPAPPGPPAPENPKAAPDNSTPRIGAAPVIPAQAAIGKFGLCPQPEAYPDRCRLEASAGIRCRCAL